MEFLHESVIQSESGRLFHTSDAVTEKAVAELSLCVQVVCMRIAMLKVVQWQM